MFPDAFGPFLDIPAAAAATAANVQGRAKFLAFSMQPQQQTKWCWAAVVASVSAYYQSIGKGNNSQFSRMSQCQLATFYLGRGDACPPSLQPNTDDSPMNDVFTLQTPLDNAQHLQNPTVPISTLQFSDVIREIDAGQPVCCHFTVAPDGHFVVIYGYQADAAQDVFVGDSAIGPINGPIPWDQFQQYDRASWDQTYCTT